MHKVNESTFSMGLKKKLQLVHFNIFSCFILASLFFFASCKKELKAPTPFPFEMGVLSANKTNVVINSGAPSDSAVYFAWSGYKNGEIYYSLILSAGGKTDTVVITKNTVSKLFNNAE